jgi:hypothetical protein
MTTRTRLGTAGLITGLLALSGAAARSAELVTLAGKKTAGTLVRVDAQGLLFREEGAAADAAVATKEVAVVDLKNPVVAPAGGTKFDEIEFVDGSIARVGQVRIKGRKVEPGLLPGPAGVPGPAFDLPLGVVYTVLRGADDPKNREAWAKLLAARGKRDLFVSRGSAGLSPLPGTVIEGTEAGDRVQFEREDGQRVSLPLTRAGGGLVFNQPPAGADAPTVCRVSDVWGNVWYAQAVEVVGSGLKVRTVAGGAVEYPSLAGVSKLDFSQGNVAYLSDLAATAGYAPPEQDGPLGDQFPYAPTYQKDRLIGPGDLALQGRGFAKGVSVPPDTTLTYRLDGAYREFKAVAGIPDPVKPDNAVLRLRIEVDGRTVFNEPVGKKDPPREITLNVKDARELRIAVERDGLLFGSQVTLADCRVQK